mmetsp:Transcript_34841/g.73485  ORF Transcript_34841/g.73485 Transcript_34841/m.73485 type:complete len:285 (-) Transcript_34841:761-1615(-)
MANGETVNIVNIIRKSKFQSVFCRRSFERGGIGGNGKNGNPRRSDRSDLRTNRNNNRSRRRRRRTLGIAKRTAATTTTLATAPPAEGGRQGRQNRRIAHRLHPRIPLRRRPKALLQSQLRDDTTTRRIRKRHGNDHGGPRHSQRRHLPLLLRPPLRHGVGMRIAHPPHRRGIRGGIPAHVGRHPRRVGVHDGVGVAHLRAPHQSMRRDGKGAKRGIAGIVHELPREDGGQIGGIGISRGELRRHGGVFERGGRSAHATFGYERRGRVGERGHDGYHDGYRRKHC